MKRTNTLFAALFFACFFTVVFVYTPVSAASINTGEIIFEPAEGSTEMSLGFEVPVEGFEEKAEMPYATYFFAGGNDWSLEEKIGMITLGELILGTGKDSFKLTFTKPNIFFVNDNARFEISRGKIILCPTDIASLGAVASYACFGRLPAWLCAGLELYCMELTEYPFLDYIINEVDISGWALEQEETGFPGFGDAWMIPGFIMTADRLHDNVPYICLEFTRYLIDNEIDGLLGIAKELLAERAEACFEPLQEYWDDFTGNTGRMGCEYHYAYRRFTVAFDFSGTERYNIVFVYYSPRTRIECVDSEKMLWQYDEVLAYAARIERSIDYVLNWLETDYDFIERGIVNVIINRVYLEDSFNYYSAIGDGEIILSNGSNRSSNIYAATHELVHYFADKTGLRTDNTLQVFSEGLPQLIQTETEWGKELNEYLIYRNTFDILLYQRTYTKAGRGFSTFYNSRMKEPYDPFAPLTLDMIYLYSDWAAGEQLLGLLPISDPLRYQDYWASRSDFDTSDLTSYSQAASFVHYLYITYGKEKLLGAFSDPYDIEKLYGKTFDELVGDWKVYIGIQEDLFGIIMNLLTKG